MFCHHLTEGTLSFLSSFYESVVFLKSVIENNCADEKCTKITNEIKYIQI